MYCMILTVLLKQKEIIAKPMFKVVFCGAMLTRTVTNKNSPCVLPAGLEVNGRVSHLEK